MLLVGVDMNAFRWTLLIILAVSVAASAQGPGVFALRTMLEDKDPEIRMKAAAGWGRGGGRQSILILRQGLTDKNSTVRVSVVEALGFIGGRLSMTVLSEALKDKSSEVRIRTVEALKDAGTVKSIPIIEKAFGDKEVSVRLRRRCCGVSAIGGGCRYWPRLQLMTAAQL